MVLDKEGYGEFYGAILDLFEWSGGDNVIELQDYSAFNGRKGEVIGIRIEKLYS